MDYKLRKTWLPLQLHKQREGGGGVITKDGSYSSHQGLWVSYLTHVQGGGGEMNMMKIKGNNWRYLLFKLILRVLSYSCSIHSNLISLLLCQEVQLLLLTVLLEFQSKEICMLTDKNLFTFISGKHSQQDARECAAQTELRKEILKDINWHLSRLERYYFDHIYS